MQKLIRWVILVLMLAACQSREVVPKVTGSEYFPLKKGAFWIYDVVETSITQVGGQSNTSYQQMISITDSVTVTQPVTYILTLLRRTDSTQPWAADGTWSVKKDAWQLIIQEGNIPYVKMAFPLAEQKSWNANAYNSEGGNDLCTDGTYHCDNYLSENLMKRFEGDGFSYDDSVTILENNDDDPIVKKDVRKSVYAKSVGLVYREKTILEYCTIGTCIGQQIVENGYIFKQTIRDYGNL